MSQTLKFRCALVAMLLTSFDASAADVARGHVFHDKNGNGIFDRNESGVRGVAVSNGREVVATDARGQYALPVSNDTILFVIKPRGWTTALDVDGISRGYYVHKPAGSPKTEYSGVAATGPLPTSLDFPL
ncbi:MAG: metallophosphoesterase N-terminal domain-containing protein, partial [Gammaproteobacteria bacterium]